MIDYAWYYAGKDNNKENFNKIPKIGDSFSIIVSEIFYDQNKLEKVYNSYTKDEKVQPYGIRCAKVNYKTTILNKNEINNNKFKFIANEFLISEKSQILPLYGITLIRIEFLVIWRDYNFNSNNPNYYSKEVFDKMQEFHRTIKNILLGELNSKVYYVENTEEAINLLNKKKYNKVIIITNGYNNGKEFIIKSREIIGAKSICGVSVYDVERHIGWVKNMENVLLLNGVEFHKRFLKGIINNDKKLLNELRKDIIEHYKDINNFNLMEFDNDLFKFPNFKAEGKFEDLHFAYDEFPTTRPDSTQP